MIIIENTLISDSLLEEKFVCDIDACKGACCIEGDKGAPLEPEELEIIKDNLPNILPHLPDKNQNFIEKNGFFEQDWDGEYVTTCMPDGRCSFVITHPNGSLGCGMEKSFYKNDSSFIKPVSCHLYPVRVVKHEDFTAVNYHDWKICSAACSKGEKENTKVYEFTKTALIRKFGQEWYDTLKALDEQQSNQ